MHINCGINADVFIKPLMLARGLKFVPGERNGISYLGKNKFLDENRRSSDIAHEFAHWLLAPAWRRKLPEFGLGDIPRKADHRTPMVVSKSTAWNEDMEAIILGMRIFATQGFDIDQYGEEMIVTKRHIKFVHLFETCPEALYLAVERLQVKKFLDADLNPILPKEKIQ